MSKNEKPWLILGVSKEARDIAKRLSKANGMTIGKWIDFQIKEIDTTPPHSLNEQALLREIEIINHKLEKIDTMFYMIYKQKRWWQFWR